ncbi:MAG: hypothetical protein IJA69_02910 [Clostridia bacterium]|nr:hypothetical protein [Clostridia bacterium]
MEKIIVDTCVFFKMIKYNNLYKQNGREILDQAIERQQKKLLDMQNKIKSVMGSEFLEKHQNLKFEELFQLFKAHAKNMDSFVESLTDNIQKMKNGQTTIPANKIDEVIEKQNSKLEMYKKKQVDVEKFLLLRKKYNALKQMIEAGRIYQKSLDKKVELCVTATSYSEIINHTYENTNMQNCQTAFFTEAEVVDLTKNHFALINVRDSRVVAFINELARQYRTDNSVGTKMADDINSLGEYGDSSIIAESNLAGINFLTQNDKDFIVDKGYIGKNDKIRQHLASVNESYEPLTTDAVAYTTEEYLNGENRCPSKQSKVFELQKLNAKQQSSDFKQEYEIVM